MSKIEKYVFKIVLLGNPAAGKTSLIARYMTNKFTQSYSITVGTNISMKSVRFDTKEIQMAIWDLAGQDSFDSVRHLYYKGARGCVLIFDLTRRETLDSIKDWHAALVKDSFVKSRIPVVIVGNKLDLAAQREVTSEEAQIVADELGATYYEASAKTGKTVEEFFTKIAHDIIDALEENEAEAEKGTKK
ncbi:MAG: Rab family GTPase [Candidatus Kariarchaeaceae archaeon]